MSIKLVIQQSPGRQIKFGDYDTVEAAQVIGKHLKSMQQFSGEIYVEHTPSLIELTLLHDANHVQLIAV